MTEPVVVLGMHRSGTSFLIRALNLSGLWLGSDKELHTVEGRAMVGNPRGNYENRSCININNAILQRSGGSWVKPPRQLVHEPSDLQAITRLVQSIEAGCPPDFPRWGWKDPRTLLTLDLWLQALGRRVFVVGTYRHPTAVARSLLQRDQIPLELGYALWAVYNQLLLNHLRALPHVLVRFDVDQEQLVAQTARICGITGLRRDPGAIASWFDPHLVRSDAKHEPLPDHPMIRDIWAQLDEMASGTASP